MLSCWKTVGSSLTMNAMLKKCRWTSLETAEWTKADFEFPCQGINSNSIWIQSNYLKLLLKPAILSLLINVSVMTSPLPCANQEALRCQGVNDPVPDDPQPRRFGDEQGDWERKHPPIQKFQLYEWYTQKDANREMVCNCMSLLWI